MKLIANGIVLAALSVSLAGCEGISLSFTRQAPAAGAAPAAAGGPAMAADDPAAEEKEPPLNYMAGSAVRGDDGSSSGSGAVDTALELSRKYAEVAEQLMAAQKANKDLTQDNRKLLAQVAKQEMAIAQAQKELDDANEQIMEQKRALQEWKKNVLGFREDMERYEEVQIDALKKILQLLNGEAGPARGASVTKPTLSAKDASSESTGKSSG